MAERYNDPRPRTGIPPGWRSEDGETGETGHRGEAPPPRLVNQAVAHPPGEQRGRQVVVVGLAQEAQPVPLGPLHELVEVDRRVVGLEVLVVQVAVVGLAEDGQLPLEEELEEALPELLARKLAEAPLRRGLRSAMLPAAAFTLCKECSVLYC